MNAITATQTELASAFTEWDRRYREEPDRFMSEAQHLLKETPETYGEACAPYLIQILKELRQRNGQTQAAPICRDCQFYAGRLFALIDSACQHPCNSTWNPVEGDHINPLPCKAMREENGPCRSAGKLFLKRVATKVVPRAVVFGGTTNLNALLGV